MKIVLKKICIFFIFTLVGQYILSFILPSPMLVGASLNDWIRAFLDLNAFIFLLIVSAFITFFCFFWVARLNYTAAIFSGVCIGGYFALIFFPHNKKVLIEELILPEDSSFLLFILLYVVLFILIPIVFVLVLSKLNYFRIEKL